MEITVGDKFSHNGSGEIVEILKVYGKTMDVRMSSGRIIPKQKIKVFLLSYEKVSTAR